MHAERSGRGSPTTGLAPWAALLACLGAAAAATAQTGSPEPPPAASAAPQSSAPFEARPESHPEVRPEPRLEALPPGALHAGDFDGDGRDDLLFHGSDGRSWVELARHAGPYSSSERRLSLSPTGERRWCRSSSRRVLAVGDFDGDGRDDLLCQQPDGTGWIDYADGQGAFHGTDWSRTQSSRDQNWCWIAPGRELFVGDFNGDGRDDLLCHQWDGKSWIDSANSRGRFHGTNWSRSDSSRDKDWCWLSTDRRLFIGDFNGDGRDDLLCHQADGRSWIDYANSGGRFDGTDWSRTLDSRQKAWCPIGSDTSLHVADFNGDGIDDLLCHSRATGELWLDRASPSGRFNGSNWSDADTAFCRGSEQSLLAADGNGDGRAELLCLAPRASLLRRFPGAPGRAASAPAR